MLFLMMIESMLFLTMIENIFKFDGQIETACLQLDQVSLLNGPSIHYYI